MTHSICGTFAKSVQLFFIHSNSTESGKRPFMLLLYGILQFYVWFTTHHCDHLCGISTVFSKKSSIVYGPSFCITNKHVNSMCTAKMVFFLCYLWETSVTGRNLIAILSLRNYHRELAAVLLVKVKQGNKQFDTATNKECYIYMYVGGELESDGIPSPLFSTCILSWWE